MITREEYRSRRQALADLLPSNCIAVIPAASEVLRNGDAHYRFRQDSDFAYLTGFNEPDALLLITSGAASVSLLFNRPRHLAQEQWSGKRLGQEDACAVLGVDKAYCIDEVDSKLPELIAGMEAIYFPLGHYPLWAKRLQAAWMVVKGQGRRGIVAPTSFVDLEPILGDLRLIKSPDERVLMQEAARVSVIGHQRAMGIATKASYEYQLEAELLHAFVREGCRDVAYDSIVAGGGNACILHYTQNNQPLRIGDLVLIDAGAECQHYAADVTRTFPLNGRFSSEQRLIYSLVLQAQKAGIARVRVGCLWDEIQKAIVEVLTAGLVDLGLLKGSIASLIEQEAYKPFYMHSSGHWLGLNVHDCGRYKVEGAWRALEEGMVLTVEPGLYIPAGMDGVHPRWWDIGVRIEDDLVVTAEGNMNLTQGLAVEVDDVEALVRGG